MRPQRSPVSFLVLLALSLSVGGCFSSSKPAQQGGAATDGGKQPPADIPGVRLEAVNFDEPAGISYAAGRLYIADTNNHQIRVVDLANNYRTGTFEIVGLAPPPMPPEPPSTSSAVDAPVEVPPPGPASDAAQPTPPPIADADLGAADADEPSPETSPKDDLTVDPAANHPFPGSVQLPFEFPEGAQWLNTAKPLKLADLKGKFVLLDFWTYCCINCIHILPELKKIERAFPNDLVVIGVHSAKFDTEKDLENIEEAILRYEIEHPVVNDPRHEIWNLFSAKSWPTIALIDPQGKMIAMDNGEFQAEPIIAFLKKYLPYYHENGFSNTKPLKFDLLKDKQNPSPLRFPGKVLADEKSNRLFVADSNHNRIVVASLDGKLIDTIGTGASGQNDGGFVEATFNKPQGMALLDDTLYVADTENHLIRRIDLKAKTVTTIAGTGLQGRNAWPGVDEFSSFAPLPERFVSTTPREFAINSPWALWIHGSDLFIAMAGPHQIWKMPLDQSEIGPYAGNGREDIVDGPLLPSKPYDKAYASFAQPSGLASDGTWLYVADSEGSSIRAVPFDSKQNVKTIVGTPHLPEGSRLFEFGHIDGEGVDVLLQHPLGVAYHDGKLYVADTYNSAIKEIDIAKRTAKTIAGNMPPPPAEKANPDDLVVPEAE